MNFLQTWMAERIADKIRVSVVSKPSNRALRNPRTLAGTYIAMRTAYGKMHHWPVGEDGFDTDSYDHDPHTIYFLATETHAFGRKHISAGLRLTKVYDFTATLSLAMWNGAVDKPKMTRDLIKHRQDVAILKKAAKKGNLWDLTRLVTAMALLAERSPKTKRATYAALLLLLGAAMKHTGPDAFWLFTTNHETKRFLDKLGIQYALLADGRIGYSDAGRSYLGWTSAPAAYEQLKSGNPVIAHLVERGYTRGATRQSGASSVS